MKKSVLISIPLFILLLIGFTQILNAQTLQWVNQFGISGVNTICMSVDDSGNVYQCGYFAGTVDFDPGPSVYNISSFGSNIDLFVSKSDSNGNFIWAKHIGNGTQSTKGVAIDVDSFGHVYITGTFIGVVDFDPGAAVFNLSPLISSQENIFILKLNSGGDFLWVKPIAGPFPDEVYDMKVDNTGAVYTTGLFVGIVDMNPNVGIDTLNSVNGAIFIQKLDASGSFVWAKQLWVNAAASIAVDDQHNVYLTGNYHGHADFNPGSGVDTLYAMSDHAYYLKFNMNGNFEWVKEVGGNSSTYNLPINIRADHFGYLFVSARKGGSMDLDPGSTVFNSSGVSSIITKLDTSGNFIWAREWLSNYSSSNLMRIQSDEFGNLYACGGIPQGGLDLDPDSGSYYLSGPLFSPAIQNQFMFILKLDSAGTFVWAESFTFYGTGFVVGASIDVGKNGNVYTSGRFNNSVDFNPGPLSQVLYPMNGSQFVLKLKYCGQNNTVAYSACDSISIGGISYYTNQNFVQLYSDVNGCDSNSIVNIAIHPSYQTTQTATACDSFIYNSQTLTSSGIYTFNQTSSFGCDSNTILHLTIHSTPPPQQLNQTACSLYTLNGQTYTSSGTYAQLLTSTNGCDSVLQLNLIINNTSNSSLSQTACDQFSLNGYNYNSSGNYSQVFTNSVGCDSILTLQLVIHHSTSYSIVQTVCNSYTFNSQTYTATGNYTQTMINSVGCDSIIHLNIIVDPGVAASSSSLIQHACNTYTLNGQTYSSTGNYTQTFTNALGCDSIVHLGLTITSINTNVTQSGIKLTSAMNSASYQWLTCPSFSLIPSMTGQSFTAAANGSYAVIVTQNSCVDTSTCYTVTGVNVNDQAKSDQIYAYPIPSDGFVNLETDQAFQNATIKLLNAIGQVNYVQYHVHGYNCLLDITNYTKGFYIVEISDHGRMKRIKLQKE